MAATLHTFVDNSHGIGHKTQDDCPCNPTRKVQLVRQLSGKYGKHYGYTSKVTVAHNALPVNAE